MESGIASARNGTWDPVERRSHRCEKPALDELVPELGRPPVDGDRWVCGGCGEAWEASCGLRGRCWVPVTGRTLRGVSTR
jgi:hypothetical protein